MAVLRNIDVSNKIGVSPATVQNWIKYALNGKIHLDLTKIGNRHYIEDTIENMDRMQKLKNQGVKYRSKTDWIQVEPSEKLYEIFNEDQLIDLVTNMEYHKFIPMKYSYTNQGAHYYYDAVQEEMKNNNATSTESDRVNTYLTEIVTRYIDQGYSVNLIELGHDYQTYTLDSTLNYLVSKKALRKYISISISEEIHTIREKTIKDLFKLDVNFAKHTIDYEKQSIQNILFKEKENDKVINICLLLRAAISNYPASDVIIGALAESMSAKDYLVVSTTLTNAEGEDRIEREVNMSASRAKRYEWLLKQLGIFKYVEMVHYEYNKSSRIRRRSCTLKDNLEWTINIGNSKKILQIPRDTNISYLYSKRYTLDEFVKLLQPCFEVHQYNTINKEQIGFAFMSARI